VDKSWNVQKQENGVWDYSTISVGYCPSSLAYSVESSLSKRWNVKNYLNKDGKNFEKVKF